MNTVQQPEVYISATHELIDEEGAFLKEGTKEFLQSAVDVLVELTENN